MSSTLVSDPNKQQMRRVRRISLSLPVKVEGRDNQSAHWEEITRLKDVSPFGACVPITRPVKRGRLVLLTLPLPRTLRCYDFLEPQYRVWSIVRRCVKLERSGDKTEYLLGVAFVGAVPPTSYVENPSTIYELTEREDDGLWEITPAPENPDESTLSSEERRHSRFDIPLDVVLEVMDEEGNVIKREDTVTENISLSGAAVFSAIDIEVGGFLNITTRQYAKTIKAVVRGKRLGPDGIPRLHIEFLDDYFPLEGIEQ